MSREELGALGMATGRRRARRVRRALRPGSPADKRAERQVAPSGSCSPGCWRCCSSSRSSGGRTSTCRPTRTASWPTRCTRPIIGATLGAPILCFGIGVVALAQEDPAARGRHPAAARSACPPRSTGRRWPRRCWTRSTSPGIKRRGMIKGSLRWPAAALGLGGRRPGPRWADQEPVGGAGRLAAVGDPWAPAADGTKVRLVQIDGTPVRPGGPGGRLDGHRVPGVPGGAKASDAAVMLFRVRSDRSSGSVTGSRASSSATTTPTRRSAPTSAARSRCTSSRPAGCCARATSRSSTCTRACSRSSARPPGRCPSCRSSWTTRGTSSPPGTSSRRSVPASGRTASSRRGTRSPRRQPDEPTHHPDQGVRRSVGAAEGAGQRRHPVPRRPAAADAAEQGLPQPLVVHARRGRALLVHRAAAVRCVPDAVLRPVDGRDGLPGRLREAARRADVDGLRVDPGHLVRGPRRPADPADPPLGGADLPRSR